MSTGSTPEASELHDLEELTARLRQRLTDLHKRTGYEDLEHAVLGLEIVEHALEEVGEHTGLGGHIEGNHDAAAHQQAEGLVSQVRRLQEEARGFLSTHPSEDLETALKALTIAEGSLHEAAERFE